MTTRRASVLSIGLLVLALVWTGGAFDLRSRGDESSGQGPSGQVGQIRAEVEKSAKSGDAAGAKKTPGGDEELYELYKVLADTIDQVERNYVKDVSRRELIEAAIDGVLGKLDPYSDYINPEEIDRFRTSVESEFGGIGIQVGVEDGVLTVISPLVGTPAYRAGITAGDRIVKIGDKSTKGMSIDDAVQLLKGKVGTQATFTVIHPRSTSPVEVTVTRQVVHVETVLGSRRNDDDSWNFVIDDDKKIGYIHITGFSRDTAKEVRAALRGLQQAGVRGLVLDLRFNPGGLLNSAIEISDLFVGKGRIVSTEGRNTKPRVWEARLRDTFSGFPMAVLVNGGSASASEIVSACLQDHKRATIIGERTFGKGSVQNVISLEGGRSALKLTTGSYHRPSGENIHRFPGDKESDVWGVKPNKGYEVALRGEQLGRMLLAQRDRLIVRRRVVSLLPPEPGAPGESSFGYIDPQLRKALDLLSIETAMAPKQPGRP